MGLHGRLRQNGCGETMMGKETRNLALLITTNVFAVQCKILNMPLGRKCNKIVWYCAVMSSKEQIRG